MSSPRSSPNTHFTTTKLIPFLVLPYAEDPVIFCTLLDLLPSIENLHFHTQIPLILLVDHASAEGHLRTLKWIYQTYGSTEFPHGGIVENAFACGQLETIQWWYDHGFLKEVSEDCMAYSVGFKNVLEWLDKTLDLKLYWNERTYLNAFFFEDKYTTQWLHRNEARNLRKCRWQENPCVKGSSLNKSFHFTFLEE